MRGVTVMESENVLVLPFNERTVACGHFLNLWNALVHPKFTDKYPVLNCTYRFERD